MTSYILTCPWCAATLYTTTDAQRVAGSVQEIARALWILHVSRDHPGVWHPKGA